MTYCQKVEAKRNPFNGEANDRIIFLFNREMGQDGENCVIAFGAPIRLDWLTLDARYPSTRPPLNPLTRRRIVANWIRRMVERFYCERTTEKDGVAVKSTECVGRTAAPGAIDTCRRRSMEPFTLSIWPCPVAPLSPNSFWVKKSDMTMQPESGEAGHHEVEQSIISVIIPPFPSISPFLFGG